MLIKLSWYNLLRNKKRSALIILMIAVGLSSGLFVFSLVRSMTQQRIHSAINNELAHIQIHDSNFNNSNDFRDTIQGLNSLRLFLGSFSEIEGISCRIRSTALVSVGQKQARVKVYGIYPAEERKVTWVHKRLIAGNYLTSDTGNFMIIGNALAEKLKLRPDSGVNLQLMNFSGAFIGSNYKVCGIYETDNYLFDNTCVFVGYQNLSQITLLNKGIHEVLIRVSQEKDLQIIENRIRNRFPGLAVQGWKEINPELRIMVDYMDLLLLILLFIILTSVSFAIINTMVMSVNERVTELGMLMAIGMSKIRIVLMIAFETLFLSLIGGIVGIGVAWVVIEYYGCYGINLSAFSKGLSAIGVQSVVYPALNYSKYLELLIVVVGVALFSSIFPAFKAFRLRLSETIKFFK